MPEGAKNVKKLKVVAPDPNVNNISVGGEKWDAEKSKFRRKSSTKGSIESWLLSNPSKSSTPVRKVEAQKSSTVSEVNVCSMGYPPSVLATSDSHELFESTTSWFMLNIDKK